MEEDLAKQLEKEEEERLGQEEHYNSLQEEAEGKTRKLKKLFAKFKAAQAEIQDVQDEFAREKEDILDTIRKLSRQLKLRQLVMTSYIPLEQLSKIERCSEWDEATEGWRISRLQFAGNRMRAKREKEGKANLAAPEASAMRLRNVDGKKSVTMPDVSAAMAAVYFSYDSEPIPEGADDALAQQQAEEAAAYEAEAEAAARQAQRRRVVQAELDSALMY